MNLKTSRTSHRGQWSFPANQAPGAGRASVSRMTSSLSRFRYRIPHPGPEIRPTVREESHDHKCWNEDGRAWQSRRRNGLCQTTLEDDQGQVRFSGSKVDDLAQTPRSGKI